MKRLTSVLAVATVVAVCFLSSSVAHAQATRTWVSGVGDDANPCSRTAPCKTFAGAISKTAAGGEISALDPGGFGAVTITKSITINGDGTLAGILASFVNGIVINAGNNDVIVLRSLSLNGGGSLGLSGVRIINAGHVRIENSTIQNFANFGIEGANGVNPVQVTVSNVSITQSGVGIKQANLANGSLIVSNTRINKGTTGIDVLGGIANVTNAVVVHQTVNGMAAQNAAVLNVTRSLVTSNNNGVNAVTAGATINLSDNDIFSNNANGVAVAGGATCNRFQNNRIFGNLMNILGVCTAQNPQ